MSETKLDELKKDLIELNSLLKQATRKRVQDLLVLEIRKLETESSKIQKEIANNAMDTTPSPTASALSTSKRYEVKLNGYGWDQSDKYVKVFVTLKNAHTVPKENVYCKLTSKSMELHVDDLENKDYILIINKLLKNIDVEKSHWKQKTDMVVVFLYKEQQAVNWSHITEIEKKFDDARANKFKPAETDDTKDPQESIMNLMKNMYETGDDETKRMIAKAWTEGRDKQKTSTIDNLNL